LRLIHQNPTAQDALDSVDGYILFGSIVNLISFCCPLTLADEVLVFPLISDPNKRRSGIRNQVFKVVLAIFVFVFLVTAAAPSFAAMSSSKVKVIQTALNKAGYHVKVDGKMGPQTETAFMKFQKAKGLSVTGKADAPTTAKLGVK